MSFHFVKCLATCCVLALVSPFAFTQDQPAQRLEFRFETAHQLEVLESGHAFKLRTTGSDPYITIEAPVEVHPEQSVLAFEYFCPDGVQGVQVFFGRTASAERVVEAGSLPKAETWQPFAVDLEKLSGGKWAQLPLAERNGLRLDFGRRDGIEVQIRDLKLREPTETERQQAEELRLAKQRKRHRAEKLDAYLERHYPVHFTKIQVTADQIVGWIDVTNQSSVDWRLVEFGWEENTWEFESIPEERLQLLARVPDDPNLAIRLPRIDPSGHDRLLSRWAVAEFSDDENWRLITPVSYADALVDQRVIPLRVRPNSIKGMGGIPLSGSRDLNELVELGVHHITLNTNVNRFIARSKEDAYLHRFNGWEVPIDKAVVAEYDSVTRFANEHGIVVSAVVLVGWQAHTEWHRLLPHPEADRSGVYAMPNLATREGVQNYAAVIDFLAERYARGDAEYGRVDNWIMHNELDYAWVWTNMGSQPMSLLMETYTRSMRLVDLVARQYNPEARVFISLTHNWDGDVDESWKTYKPRHMLEWLALASKVEGNFPWGVAYHPYPESLFKADTWNDRQSSYRFDTPMITLRNIEVLDAFMKQNGMRYHGNVRPIVLSEQGFHTDKSYSKEIFDLQSAAFVYAWEKLRHLSTIEAFHNHRWVDHPNEGGLLLGIRTLPNTGSPFGEKKPGWYAYQALETSVESKYIEMTQGVIGVQDLDDIRYQGPIE